MATVTTTITKKPNNLTRHDRAKQIVLSGMVVKHSDGEYRVISQKDPKTVYAVNMSAKFCECKDHELTQTDCKHIIACRLYEKVKGL